MQLTHFAYTVFYFSLFAMESCHLSVSGIALSTRHPPLNVEKKIPREWINEAGNGVLQPFIEYALPLIQGESCRQVKDGLAEFAKLKLKLA